ncbi:spore gernimation protein [Bacillus taeanensis]|uniref:Spore gernimation protein n=2 Tax=Bacillus taeanensis TaxID=273032 RepID=A0A366XT38_9BACI|nr:spore gernimation protein [Bacillus taeanensis]
MVENSKISRRQFTILVSLFVIGDTILYVPSNVATESMEDSWISALISLGVGLLLVSLYSVLGSRFPNITLIEMSEKILGSWFGKIVGILLVSYFFLDSGVILWQVGDFIVAQVLPDTPIQFVLVIFLLVVVIAMRLGIEALSHAAEIFFPVVIVLFFILIFLIFPQVELKNLQPLLGEGFKPAIRGSLPLIGYYLESVILLMIFPCIQQKIKVGRAYRLGMFIGGSLLFIIIFFSIAVLGADFTNRHIYPSYMLAKKITVGHFLERIEVVMASIWFFTLFIKLSLCFYASLLGTAQLLRLKNYRILTFPFAVLLVIVSLAEVPDSVYFNTFVLSVWWPYTLGYGLVLPLLLLAASKFRKKL